MFIGENRNFLSSVSFRGLEILQEEADSASFIQLKSNITGLFQY